MLFNDDKLAVDQDDQSQNKATPNAHQVNDDDNMEENDLKKTFLFGKGDDVANPTEGKGNGGQKFGEENLTPSGDDKNNPSRYGGYTNAYFARTEPSEEHPENSNFTAKDQDGAPDYIKAQAKATNVSFTNGGDEDDDQPDTKKKEDEQVNIPGPGELPDQQKVGEDDDAGSKVKKHIE
jgi:hypothetical protein